MHSWGNFIGRHGSVHGPTVMRLPLTVTHIVLQALNDLDAVVTQVEFLQVDQTLQTLHLGDAVTLEERRQDNIHLNIVLSP